MFFPIFLDVRGKKVLVVGGGKLGFRKSETLREYDADITLYSEKIEEKKLLNLDGIKIVNKNIENDDRKIRDLVKDYFLVIAATDNLELNDRISDICMEENILVNNTSSKTEMNVMFGAVVSNDEFQVSVSTGGRSCRRSKALKGEIAKILENLELKNLETGEVKE